MRSWLWWAYVVLLGAAGIGRTIERLAVDSGGFWSRIGPPLGAMLICAGVAAWLTKRRLINVWIWRAVHVCVVVAQIIGIAFAAWLLAIPVYGPASYLFLAAVMLIPSVYALFQYSYRLPDTWNTR